jgi:uncharacterized protein YqeY
VDRLVGVAGPEEVGMALLDDVNKALAGAMKAREQLRLDALRMLKAALVNRAVEKGRALDETEAGQVVASLIKQRRDSIEQFTAGGREDLARKEAAEIEVLQHYMPEAVEMAEVERAIAEAIAEAGATSPRDLGRVMKLVMARFGSRGVDGKTVNEIVRRRLSGS